MGRWAESRSADPSPWGFARCGSLSLTSRDGDLAHAYARIGDVKLMHGVALLCCVASSVALTGMTAGADAAASDRSFLALVGNGTTESVAMLDPVSLRRLPGKPKVYLGLHDIPYSFSPDGSLLALGSGRTGSFVIVDTLRMRRLAKLGSSFTAAISWLSGSRLVVVESHTEDLVARIVQVGRATRFVGRYTLPLEHDLIGFAEANGAVVLLLAPRQELGHPTLAVITGAGLRTVPLTAIPAGTEPPPASQGLPVGHYAYPALALDPDTQHAYVVSGTTTVARIDLSSLAVEYHDLASFRITATIADGGGNRLGEGFSREAAWVGGGRLAVSGSDDWIDVGPDGQAQRSTALGLHLIDTRDWTQVVVDEQADWFAWSGSFLATSSSEPQRFSVYTPDGKVQFRRPLPPDGFQLSGHRAYLTLGSEYRAHRVRVVDLQSGRTLRTVQVPGWFYPLSREVPASCWC